MALHQRFRQPIGPTLLAQRQPDKIRTRMADEGKRAENLAGNPCRRASWRFCASKRATVPSSIQVQISELTSEGVFHVVARIARSISGR